MYSTVYEKNDCMKLYYAFLKNKNLNYPEFIATINKELNKNYDINDLKRYIVHIKKYRSITNAEIMADILKNSLSDKRKKTIIINDEKKDFNGRIIMENKIDLDDKMKYLNDNIDLIINNNETIDSLYKKGNITNQCFMTEVKKYIKHLDKEKYVDFLIKNHNLNTYTTDELCQFLFTIKYFIKNIHNKLNYLYNLDPVRDYENVKKIYISEEDNLSELYKTNPSRLYTWKKQKLERSLKVYNELFDSIQNLLKNNDIKDLKRISPSSSLFLKDEENFILEYYIDLMNLKKEYKNCIKSLKDINDLDKKELEKIYIKKVIIENNK